MYHAAKGLATLNSARRGVKRAKGPKFRRATQVGEWMRLGMGRVQLCHAQERRGALPAWLEPRRLLTSLVMQPLRVLSAYIALVFIGGALLAPWLYWLSQATAETFPRLADAPFHRFVNRSLLLVALAGLWPLLRSLGATSLQELGWQKAAGQWKRFLTGFAWGFVCLALVAGIALVAGERVLKADLTAARMLERIAGAALTAMVVATLEETLFRGGIFGGLRRVLHWSNALVISSLVYAIAHFLERAKYAEVVSWHSGLELLPRMLRGFVDWHHMVPGFFNLTLAGALLALAYQRTGSLCFSTGLHAGWIFWLKCYGALTTSVPGSETWLLGTNKLIDGWLALAVLALTLAAFTRPPPLWKTDAVT